MYRLQNLASAMIAEKYLLRLQIFVNARYGHIAMPLLSTCAGQGQ